MTQKQQQEKIEKEWLDAGKQILLYTVVLGIITHGFRFTNTMLCADSTNYLNSISPSWVTSLGRFVLPVVEKVRGPYELTWLIGVLSTIFIGVSATFVALTLDIKDKLSRFLLSWLMVASPVVTSIFAYMYTADGYMLGLLFAVLAVFCCVKIKGSKGIILGSVSLMVSLGFYQAFITTTIMVILLYLIRQLLEEKNTWADIGKKIARFLGMGISGLLLYLITLKLVWKVGGYGTTSYMGMDSGSGFQFENIAKAAVECCVDFARFFLVRWEWTFYNATNVLLFVLMAVMLIWIITKKKMWKDWKRWGLILGFLILIPFLTHAFEFASAGVSYTSTSMSYSLTMIFAFPLLFASVMGFEVSSLQQWKENWSDKKNCIWVAGMVLLLLISFHFTVIANKAYYNMETANTKVEMLINRLMTRMEMLEGYNEEMEVAVVGSCFQDPEYVSSAPMMSGVVSNIFISQPTEYVSLMKWYLSKGHHCASAERIKELVNSSEFQEMGHWPAENSVRIIDGTIVLYLSDVGIGQYLEE